MIKVQEVKEPENFDSLVRCPGKAYLAAHPGKEPKNLWNACKADLYTAYQGYCAYTTFRINSRADAVVDHFKPKKRYPESCYEWSNYRLSSFHINSVKKDSEEIYDPFQLPEDAFHLSEDMQIYVNKEAFASEADCELARRTITRLRLDGQESVDDRRAMIEEALSDMVEAHGKKKDVLLVARQLYRQSRFLYREAVRLGYIESVPSLEES